MVRSDNNIELHNPKLFESMLDMAFCFFFIFFKRSYPLVQLIKSESQLIGEDAVK